VILRVLQEILNTFVVEHAPFQINVSSQLRLLIISRVSSNQFLPPWFHWFAWESAGRAQLLLLRACDGHSNHGADWAGISLNSMRIYPR
jgi:hypothetical protein